VSSFRVRIFDAPRNDDLVGASLASKKASPLAIVERIGNPWVVALGSITFIVATMGITSSPPSSRSGCRCLAPMP